MRSAARGILFITGLITIGFTIADFIAYGYNVDFVPQFICGVCGAYIGYADQWLSEKD